MNILLSIIGQFNDAVAVMVLVAVAVVVMKMMIQTEESCPLAHTHSPSLGG